MHFLSGREAGSSPPVMSNLTCRQLPPPFFLCSRPDKAIVCPEYLAAILNAPQSKAIFRQIGGGTSIFSIRTSELAAFEIPLPSMEQQKRIASLAGLHRQDIDLMHKLIAQKQDLYTAIISKLIN